MLFGDLGQPPRALTVTWSHPQQLHTVGHPAQRAAHHHLTHRDAAPPVGKIAQLQRDPAFAAGRIFASSTNSSPGTLRSTTVSSSNIENIDPTSQQFIDELTKLREAVLAHAAHEENEEFPKLQTELDADDLKGMAKAVRAAEAIAPTRPHPGVESAKLNFAVGPFTSMLDRARDAIQQAVG